MDQWAYWPHGTHTDTHKPHGSRLTMGMRRQAAATDRRAVARVAPVLLSAPDTGLTHRSTVPTPPARAAAMSTRALVPAASPP